MISSLRWACCGLVCLALAGCTLFTGGPSNDEVAASIKAVLSPFLAFSLEKTDSTKIRDNLYQISFKGTISAKEDLFVMADAAKEYQKRGLEVPTEREGYFLNAASSAPALKLLTLSVPAGTKYEIYGKCGAEYTVDKWNVAFSNFDTFPNIQGQPRSAFGTDFLIVGSAEANGAFDQLLKAKTESDQKKQALLNTIVPFISGGAVFEGIATYRSKTNVSPAVTQKVRFTFGTISSDGTIIEATVSNPDDSMDAVPVHGAINTSVAADKSLSESESETKFRLAYPIELTNDLTNGSWRDVMKSWQYYSQYGFNFRLGIKDGNLVGKGVLGGVKPDNCEFDFVLLKK